MKRKKKFLIVLGITLLLIMTSITGTLFFYYTHPDSVEQLIERVVYQSMGMECTIEALSYSLDPLTVRAERISLGSYEDQTAFHLRISDLSADMVREGRFGRKTLIIEQIRIHKPLLSIPAQFVMPEYTTGQSSPSFLSHFLGWTFRWLMFREISLQKITVSEGQIISLFGEQKVEIKGLRADMNPDHLIGISCNLVFEWPSQDILFTAPEIHMTTQDAISLKDIQIAGFFEATNASLQSPVIDVKDVETKGAIQYSQKNNVLDFGPIEFRTNEVHFKQDSGITRPRFSAKSQLRGFINIETRKFGVTELDVKADDILQLEGKMDISMGDQTDIRLDILQGSLLSERLLALLPDNGMEGVTLNVSGPVSFQGEINGQKKHEGWAFYTDLDTRLDGNELSLMRDQNGFEGKLSGDFSVSGELPNLSLSADLKSEQIRMKLAERDLFVKQVRIEVTKGEMDIKHTSLLLPNIRFESSPLKNIQASLALEQGQLDLKLQGQDVGLIESAQMFGLMPSEWRFEGLSDLQLNAEKNGENGWAYDFQIGLHHLAFENTGAGYLGDSLSLLLETNGALDSKGSTVVFRTALSADEGEILMDRFYLNLGSNEFSSSLKGIYNIPEQRLEFSSQQIQLKDILDLTLEGTLHLRDANPYADLSVKMPQTPLKPLFHHLVLEPFQTETPFVASLDLSGDVSADLNFEGSTSEWLIKGHGWWNEGRLDSGNMGFNFSGIELDLPVWLQTQNIGRQPEPVQGKLIIKNLDIPIVDDQPLELSLKMDPNRFFVEEPTVLTVQGGVAEVGPIFCENVMSSKRSIKTNLRLEGIDAGLIFSQLLPIPVEGIIEGQLDAVRFEENTLHSSGQIRAQVFEGETLISNPGISGPFSSFPLYKANISINDLNLYQMTKGTSFGEIEGLLQGYIHDLEIANGQPQKFDLLLETVETKGIDQEISVRAVDNIARIGGGSSPFLGLAGLVASVIQKFPYSKIGIRSSLQNDAFRINGTVKENGQEYLVKRGSFSGVNVVNRNPNTSISFKDMVKRVGRIITSEKDPKID